MNSEELTQAVAVMNSKIAGREPFGSTIRFDFKNGTSIYIDGKSEPPQVVENGEGDADCTVSAAPDVFKDLVAGDLDPTAAFMTGKVSIDGDMTAALQLQKVLG